jgi:hypothetical protein
MSIINIKHPFYNKNDLILENDIAVMRLSSGVQFTSEISPICLSPDRFAHRGRRGIVIGWVNGFH